MKPWQRLDPTKITQVGWRTIVTKTFRTGRGQTGRFDTMGAEGQEFAAVVAITKDHQAVIARQYRAGPERLMEELPAGYVDPGEAPEEAARREMLEESGYQAEKLTYLGKTCKDAYMNGTWYYYLAVDCMKVAESSPDEYEDIEVDLISIEDLIHNAKTDRMTDPLAVFLAYDQLAVLAVPKKVGKG